MIEFPTLHSEAFEHNQIYYHQEDVSIDLPDTEKLFQTLAQMAENEHAALRELNYIFCSDAYLLEVNKTHLQHDFYTDVITFPHLEKELCGDIFISSDRISENAKAHSVSFEHELVRVMLHGALHLAGYQDQTLELKLQMRQKEDFYLGVYFTA